MGPGLIEPHWPDAPANVGASISTRCGGASTGHYDDGIGGGGLNLGLHVGDDAQTVAHNRGAARALLPGAPVWLSQVHGVTVINAASVVSSQPLPVADASIATQSGLVCAVMTADCLPVLFADLAGSVVGAAHAGWRGLAAGVLGGTVAAMRAAGAGELTAYLGPAIGPTRFEVGQEVLDCFLAGARNTDEVAQVRAAFVPCPGQPDKFLANINTLARHLLARNGVTRVWGGHDCTVTNKTQFYSYRRDGVTGRQASLIWLKPV